VLPLIAPLFFLVAGLLMLAGVGKVWRPRPAAQALYAAGLPGSEPAVRGLGLVEIVAGVGALIRPSPWSALLVAALYLAFAVFVAFLLLARPHASSCGCSGSRETPPSWLHVSMNLAAVAVASIAAVVGTPSLLGAADSLGVLTVPAVFGLATAGWLAVVVASEVPAAFHSWTSPTHHEQALFDPDRHRRADVALMTAGVDAGHASLWPDHDPATGQPLGDADVGR
jgi:Methylamine utilisation protein MauE